MSGSARVDFHNRYGTFFNPHVSALSGALNTGTHPSGRVITMAYGADNRPTKVQGLLNGVPTNYVSSIPYAPQPYNYGGPGRTYTYNSRLQPQERYARLSLFRQELKEMAE